MHPSSQLLSQVPGSVFKSAVGRHSHRVAGAVVQCRLLSRPYIAISMASRWLSSDHSIPDRTAAFTLLALLPLCRYPYLTYYVRYLTTGMASAPPTSAPDLALGLQRRDNSLDADRMAEAQTARAMTWLSWVGLGQSVPGQTTAVPKPRVGLRPWTLSRSRLPGNGNGPFGTKPLAARTSQHP